MRKNPRFVLKRHVDERDISEAIVNNEKIEHQFKKPTESMKPPRVGERKEFNNKKCDTSVAKITSKLRKKAGHLHQNRPA